ncbi:MULTISPECIES: exosortase B [Deefgea]|uniref:Exosortase B n=1 Tax=Deefgea chitinilytica TaxID=570276 RepID=A0ABS2CDX2_9NEIS|nr:MULTISPECIES: exosortase B [Deefgea]MBM5572344.1 exosortase B [Deefgea chitinilytica]MBM9889580.1 exosortase B [Deefgea sp. CFH1-16]
MNLSLSINQTSAIEKVWPILIGLILMFVPAFWWITEYTWSKENQGHGPIVFAIGLWLIYRSNDVLAKLINEGRSNPIAGWVFFLLGCFFYIIGKSQSIDLILAGSFIVVMIGVLLLIGGWAAIRALWFPLFFMLFMLPLPGALVTALTMPMKTAVSYVAELALYHAGYPVSRSGVIIQIGQYQMLVADACAGLHTVFTLEAIGLLYLNMMGYKSALRNVIVALMVIPISFTANTIRVIVLILITYYFGDEAGQGFLHGFAGIVLFGVALFLLMSFDTVLGVVLKKMGIQDAGLKKSK